MRKPEGLGRKQSFRDACLAMGLIYDLQVRLDERLKLYGRS